ncbi:hypothetical protein V8F20_003035 [Naviculisporaceae sp. PSN 640]
MESIQLAQMLADLSELNSAAESQAALNLVNANKNTNSSAPAAAPKQPTDGSVKASDQAPIRPGQRHHQRVTSSSSLGSRTNSPAKFDTIGRRILTPPLSRTNSAQGSIPGTPRRDTEVSISQALFESSASYLPLPKQSEDDVDRASSLMALYEIRAKLKQQDNTSLAKLREKITALKARQDADHGHHGARPVPHTRYTYPKSSPLDQETDNVD